MPWTDRTKRRLKLRDMEVLLAVIDTGSMGKAANRLRMSQPAVSKSVVELEDALGVRLLDRNRRGVVPTPHGLALHRQGAVVFNELKRAVEQLDFISDPTRGEVRIGTTDPVAISLVSPLIDAVLREHPKMSFYVYSGGTKALCNEVVNRRVEFAVCRLIGRLPEDLAVEILFRDALVVVASANHRLARRRKLDWTDLTEEPWTFYPTDDLFGSIVADTFRANGLEVPTVTVVSESFNIQRELMETGRFLSVLPSFLLKLSHPGLPLKALPVSLPNSPMPVGIVTLRDRSLTPAAAFFIDRLRARVRPLAASL
jgi:DNA-binding transcriptional LysR family regulator